MTRTDRGRALLDEARESFTSLQEDPTSVDLAGISAMRAKGRSAMDWLEDTDAFEEAHQALDQIGTYVRAVRPDACELLLEDGTYFQTCPVKLAHNRVGLSTTYVIRESECSVCHQDPWDCDHVLGELYKGEVAHVIITRADIIEASLVSRPRQPDARITRVSLSSAELADELGADFSPGVTIYCGFCLSKCAGVSDSFDERMAEIAERESDPSGDDRRE